jgi:hypothetical protein
MFEGRTLRESQFIEMERADRVYKPARHLSHWAVKRCAAHPYLFCFKAKCPCFEMISRGHKILGVVALSIALAIIRSASYTCPAASRVFSP